MTAGLVAALCSLLVSTSLGNQIRIGYLENPSAVIVDREAGNVTQVSGFAVDLAKWISAYNNFEYDLIQLEYAEGFKGMGKELNAKDLNFAVPAFGVTAERNRIATFLFPTEFPGNTLIVPYPRRESDPWSCLKPFTFTVWICIVVCIFLMTFLMNVPSSLGEHHSSSFTSLNEASMYVIGVITNQGGYCSSKTRSTRLVAATWCLAAMVIVNAYSSLLITFITTPRIKLLINSLEELAQRDDVQLLAVKDSFVRIKLESAKGSLERLSSNMARVPENICGTVRETDFDHCLEKVKNGHCVFAVDYPTAMNLLLVDFKKNRKCTVTAIEESFYSSLGAFVVPLNTSHEFRNAFDVSILKAVSYGLIQKMKDNYDPVRDRPCSNYESHYEGLKQLSLVDLSSAFILLGLGYVLAFIALVYEILSGNTK